MGQFTLLINRQGLGAGRACCDKSCMSTLLLLEADRRSSLWGARPPTAGKKSKPAVTSLSPESDMSAMAGCLTSHTCVSGKKEKQASSVGERGQEFRCPS